MAGKTLTALEKINQQLTCPIHLEGFVDPRLLSCHHVFCCKCLYELADNGTRGTIVCPTCRHLTRLPQDGVRGLATAFDVLWLFELRETLAAEQREKADGHRQGSIENFQSGLFPTSPTPPPLPPRHLVSPTPSCSNSDIQHSDAPPIPPRGLTTPPPPRDLNSSPSLTILQPISSSSSTLQEGVGETPHQKLENWYIECSRGDAKQLLQYRQDGTFLIRPAGQVTVESEGVVHTHTIDVINKDKLCHIKILLCNGKYGLARGSCTFESLSEMVVHYSKVSLQCHNNVIITTLATPVFAS